MPAFDTQRRADNIFAGGKIVFVFLVQDLFVDRQLTGTSQSLTARIGMRVTAAFTDTHTDNILEITHFEPVDE